MTTQTVLELNDATVMKGERRILDSLSLTIRRGEHTAILGPNGSGKSSLIKLLTHQHYPLVHRDGSAPVRVLGEDRWNIADLRSRLGIVSPDLQQSFVVGTGTGSLGALDTVISGFFASEVIFLHHEVTDEMRERAMRALELASASHLSKKRLNEMSTGEARRVLIARAMVTSPPVLVLDEPTTGLDLVARQAFLTRLRRIAREETTILLITHHVEEILPEIDRVVLLQCGRVVYDGPKHRAMDQERLGTLFGAPVALREDDGWFGMSLHPGAGD